MPLEAEIRPQTLLTKLPVTPERLRRFLERRGPIFVKAGQHLALRPDLIDQAFCDELLKMADRVPPFPYDEAARIIAEDLGSQPDELFEWINPRPLAAGSLAQVHLARTLTGDEVAVKVQRPKARELVERDLGRARVLHRILQIAGAGDLVSTAEVMQELKNSIRDELDFELELRNQTHLYQLSIDTSRSRIPRPYPALSGPRVLTAEYLSGIPFTEVLQLVRTGRHDKLRLLQIDPRELASNLLHTVLDQVFRLEFFHADIHPGNVLALSSNRIGFVDFGLTDSLDPHFRQGMLRYLAAVNASNVELMFDGLTEIVVADEESDLSRLRSDFYEESGRWLRERRQRDGQTDSPHARFLIGVLRAARRSKFRVPGAILSLYRSVLTAETIARQLGGRETIAQAARPLLQQLQIKAFLDAFALATIQPLVLDGLRLLRDGPRRLNELLSDMTEGRLVIRVRTVDSQEDRALANARARLVSVATASVGVAFLIGATQGRTLFGWIYLSTVFWSALAVLWGWMILQFRLLR